MPVNEVEGYSYFQFSRTSHLYKDPKFIEFASSLFKNNEKFEGLSHFIDDITGEFTVEPFDSRERACEFEKYFNDFFALFANNLHMSKAKVSARYFCACPHCRSENEILNTEMIVCLSCHFAYEPLFPDSKKIAKHNTLTTLSVFLNRNFNLI